MQAYNQKNVEQAKQAAQRIYKRMNFDGGNLQSYELTSLLQQTYDFLKIPFKPTTNDVKEYTKVLDANGDGAVNLADLQALAVQYLCGDGVLSGLSTSKASGGFNQSNYSGSSFQNKANTNDYLNYSSSNNAQHSQVDRQPAVNNYNNYTSGSQYTNEQPYNTSKNSYSGGNQQQQFQGTSSNSISSQQRNQYATKFGGSNVDVSQQHMQSKIRNERGSMVVEEQKSKYTVTAQNYLTITRGLFKKYRNVTTNTITKEKVSSLLNETYSALGRNGYYPSEEDVNVWMKLCDTNSDGHVEEAEYEYFVVRALERSGVKVNM